MDLFKLMPTGLAWAGENIKRLICIAQAEFTRLNTTLESIPFESLPTHTHQFDEWEDALLLPHDETKSAEERRQEICKKFLTNIGNDIVAYKSIAKIYDPNSKVIAKPFVSQSRAGIARAGTSTPHKALAPATIYFIFYVPSSDKIIKEINNFAQAQVEFKFIFLPDLVNHTTLTNRSASISGAN